MDFNKFNKNGGVMKFINLKSISISLATLLFVASLAIVGCGKKAEACTTPDGKAGTKNDKNVCVANAFSGLNFVSQDGSFVTFEIDSSEDAEYIIQENN